MKTFKSGGNSNAGADLIESDGHPIGYNVKRRLSITAHPGDCRVRRLLCSYYSGTILLSLLASLTYEQILAKWRSLHSKLPRLMLDAKRCEEEARE